MNMALQFKYKKSFELFVVVTKILCPTLRQIIRRRTLSLIIERNKTSKRFNHTMAGGKLSDVPSSSHVTQQPKKTVDNFSFRSKINVNDIEDLKNNFLPFENSGIISLILLKCCTNFVPYLSVKYKLELSQNILEMWEKNNKKMTQDHYEVLLQCYTDNGHNINLNEFLSELESAEIHPDVRLYSLLLKCLCSKSQMDDALKVIEKMENNGISLEESHYSDLIYGWALLKDFEKVNKMIRLMKSLDIPIGNSVYMSLLRVFSIHGDISLLEQHFDMASNKQIKFTDKQIIKIIENLEIHQHYDLIPKVLDWKETYNARNMRELLLKLVFNNYLDEAFHLIEVAREKNINIINNKTNYFLWKLYVNKLPIDELILISSMLVDKGIDEYALHKILRSHFNKETTEDCKKVLIAMKDMDIQIRHHYFWPSMLLECSKSSEKGILKVLGWMKEFKMDFDIATMIQIVLPRIKVNYCSCAKFSDVSGWSRSQIRLSIFVFYLKTGQILKAADFVQAFPRILAYCTKTNWLTHLGKGILKSSNIEGLKDILKVLNPSLVDTFLLTLSSSDQDPNTLTLSKLTSVLEVLFAYQWKITDDCYQTLKKELPKTMLTPYIEKLLKEIVGEEIIYGDRRHDRKASFINFGAIENLEQILKQTDENLVPLLERIFIHYVYSGSWKEAFRIKCKLVEEGADLSTFVMRMAVFTVYVMNKDLANSKKCFFDLQRNYPEYKLPMHRVLDFCTLLAEKGLHKDSLKILSEGKFNLMNSKDPSRSLRILMEAVATQNSRKLFDEYFQVLNGHVNWSNFSLVPCVKGFVERGNLEDAVQMFESICFKYNATPHLVNLMDLAMIKNDRNALSRIKRASLAVMGKVKTIMEEIVAVSNVGDIERLRQILEGEITLGKAFQKKCQNLVLKGNIKGLTNFYHALEKSGKEALVLSFIFKCYDRMADYEGAEKFRKTLEENKVKVPKSFRKQNNFLS